jgi:hypothetical protein
LAGIFGLRLMRTPAGMRAVVGVVFAVAATYVATTPSVDVDIWWIAAAGRDMLASGHVPRVNGYSFAAPGQPWVMHEWLLGPLFALGFRALGPSFGALATLSLLAVAVWLVLDVATRDAPVRATALGLLTLVLFGRRFLTIRPMGIALLLSVAFAIVAFRPRFQLRSLILLVGLELLWANAHGSFPLGVVLLAASAFDATVDRGMRAAAAGLALLVTFANPYGFHLHAFVFRYLLGDRGGIHDFIRTHIAEFLPLWRNRGATVGPLEVLGLFVFGVVAVRALYRREWRVRGALCLALLAMAISSVRHFEQFGLLTFVLLGPMVWGSTQSPRVATRWMLIPGIVLGSAAFAFVRTRRAADDWVAPTLGGASLPRLIAALPDGARVVTTFPAAGRVIWLGAPRGIRVLYDPRNDCYPRSVAEDAFVLDAPTATPHVARTILDRYGADTLVLPTSSRIATFASEAGWRVVRQDGAWSLIARR